MVGSASLIAQDMDTRPELSPWLASVYVAAEHRRQGIGSALVRRVAQEAAALGVETLYLFTPDQEHFYARLGLDGARALHLPGLSAGRDGPGL